MKVDKIKEALLKTMSGYSVKIMKQQESRIDFALIDGFGSVAVICKLNENCIFSVTPIDTTFTANPYSLKNLAEFIQEVEGKEMYGC